MTQEWTALSEKLPELHRVFDGQPVVQMSLLVSGKDEKSNFVDVPRDPASFAYVLEQRMGAPEDAREAWQMNNIFTGDGSVSGREGDNLIILDSQHLRRLAYGNELYEDKGGTTTGVLVLPWGSMDELKEYKEFVYFTSEEVGEATGRGYVKKDGVWTPETKTVGKVWDALSRGRDLTSYVQLVSENSPQSDSLLKVYFNRETRSGRSTMRSWVALGIKSHSDANSRDYGLNNYYGRLVGIARRRAFW